MLIATKWKCTVCWVCTWDLYGYHISAITSDKNCGYFKFQLLEKSCSETDGVRFIAICMFVMMTWWCQEVSSTWSWPTVQSLLLKLHNLYVTKKNTCIDESMIPFKWCIFFHQCIPLKRTRFGINVWVLAESSTVYVSKFFIYTRKSLDNAMHTDLAWTVKRQRTEHICNYRYYLYLGNSQKLASWVIFTTDRFSENKFSEGLKEVFPLGQ